MTASAHLGYCDRANRRWPDQWHDTDVIVTAKVQGEARNSQGQLVAHLGVGETATFTKYIILPVGSDDCTKGFAIWPDSVRL